MRPEESREAATPAGPAPSCPVCAGQGSHRVHRLRDYETDHADLFDLHECEACGLLFVSPPPSLEALRPFYPESFSCYNESHFPGARLLWALLRRAEVGRIERLLAGRAPASILDIGCADAGFLGLLEGRVAQRYGIEMDAAMVARARARLGAGCVVHGALEVVDAPWRNIDVVRLNHVIEHFVDPVLALTKVNRFLRAGGVLVGETPNIDCADRRLFGRYWGGYSVPRHLHLFGRRSLAALLRRTGFDLVRVETRLVTVGWSGGIQNLLVGRLGLRPPPTGRFRAYPLLILATLPLTLVQALLGATGVMGFVARKVASG